MSTLIALADSKVAPTNSTMSSSEIAPQWYPCPPPQSVPVSETPYVPQPDPKERLLKIFQEINVKYLESNNWSGIPKDMAQATRHFYIHGTEARLLPPNHFLHGQYGLFALQRFSKFDIIGEYCGKIAGKNAGGHYVAALEDKPHEESLGIDAEHWGNEMRFINSYLNVGFKANVTMRTAYVNTYPHIMIVAQEDIEIGDELLLDYGDAYTQAYLTSHTNQVVGNLSSEELLTALPMGGSSSDEEN